MNSHALGQRCGAFAHFDFLQFEQIEMLRDARALYFPPADFNPDQTAAAEPKVYFSAASTAS